MLCGLFSYLRLRRSVSESVPYRDNVRLCDRVSSPFILGMLRPRIYLPSDLEEPEMAFVLAHEHAHLQRGDPFWKPLGFLLLAGAWKVDEEYVDWGWWLAREEGGEWQLMTWGY